MRRMLLLPAMAFCAVGRDETPIQADLGKLTNPVSRQAEVSRLMKCDEVEKFLTSYRLLEAPQKGGAPALRILAAATEYDFQRKRYSHALDEYPVEKPEQLFKINDGLDAGAGEVRYTSRPSLTRLEDHRLLVMDEQGSEIALYGRAAEIEQGYIFDFDHNGVLDLATRTRVSLEAAPEDQVDVFELSSIEETPRPILKVIYNWHPNDARESSEWGFTCYDEEGDGFVEIAFGPRHAKSEADQRRFVLRWDPDQGRYVTGAIPPKSHIRILQQGDDLDTIASAGGLGYEVQFNQHDDDKPRPKPAQAPYIFKSLKGASDEAISAFFNGKKRRDHFSGPEDAVQNQVPTTVWDLDAKQAALALADANRTATHRHAWKLAVDDRDGIQPPQSGWILYNWGSSRCYSFSSHLFALRFGPGEGWLLATDYNSNGVVGRNPLADQPGYTARAIPLEAEEARFLADLLFWLDRIRSYRPSEADESGFGSGSSSADGSASLHFIADGCTSRSVGSFNTVWATQPISSGWRDSYSPTVCINLCELLLAEALPQRLGEKWLVAPEIDRRSLTTSIEDRLKPRLDNDARLQLSANLKKAFEFNLKTPLPAPALRVLVESVGQEALLDRSPDLQRLQSSLRAPNSEDAEYDRLEKRFRIPSFGQKELTPEEEKDRARYELLVEKREFEMAAVLREPLEAATKRLQMAGDPKRLEKETKNPQGDGKWALDRLRKSYPLLWEDSLIMGFQEAPLEEQRNIIETLGAARPEAAKGLITLMTPKQLNDCLIEVASFEAKEDKERIALRVPALFEIAGNREKEIHERGAAMQLLAGINLDKKSLSDLKSLLLAELKNPQADKSFGSYSTLSAAIDALSRLPEASSHLEEISEMKITGSPGFDQGLESMIRLSKDHPQRGRYLEAFIKPCLKKHPGMMNDVFLAILALELDGFDIDLAAFATENSEFEDGDGADYSGGHFKGPSGERYHSAREVLALKYEKDPETLAKMWIAFVASHAYHFGKAGDDTEMGALLRKKAATAVRSLSPDERKKSEAIALMNLGFGWRRTSAATVLADMENW